MVSSLKDFVFVQSFIGYCHSFNIVIQANKGLLVLWIFRIFPRSCWFIWSCNNFIDAFRIITWACVMSFDQETNAVVFGCIGKASLEANLWIIYKMVISVSRGMVVNSSERPASRFMNSMIPLCSASNFHLR